MFTGTLPCASCPGIDVHLLLKNDGFREVTWYIDREEGPFKTTGTWRYTDNDSLILHNNSDEYYKQFLLVDETLRLLDRDGNNIEGDLEEHTYLRFSEMEYTIRNSHKKFKEDGVEFLASGNEPFWSVWLMENDSLQYRTPEIQIDGFISDVGSEGEPNSIHSLLETGERLDMKIREEYCIDSMSGFLFTHTVTVQMQGNEMNGCGRYL